MSRRPACVASARHCPRFTHPRFPGSQQPRNRLPAVSAHPPAPGHALLTPGPPPLRDHFSHPPSSMSTAIFSRGPPGDAGTAPQPTAPGPSAAGGAHTGRGCRSPVHPGAGAETEGRVAPLSDDPDLRTVRPRLETGHGRGGADPKTGDHRTARLAPTQRQLVSWTPDGNSTVPLHSVLACISDLQ